MTKYLLLSGISFGFAIFVGGILLDNSDMAIAGLILAAFLAAPLLFPSREVVRAHPDARDFGTETIEFACDWLKDDIEAASEDDPSVGINPDPELADLFRHIQLHLPRWIDRDLGRPARDYTEHLDRLRMPLPPRV